MKLTDLRPEDVAFIKQQGLSPDEYIRDEDTGEAVRRDKFGSGVGTFAEAAAEGVLPALASLAGGTASTAAIGSRYPQAVSNPIGGMLSFLPGALAGGGIAGFAQNEALNSLNPDYVARHKLAEKAHPYWAAAGRIAGSIPSFGAPLGAFGKGLAALGEATLPAETAAAKKAIGEALKYAAANTAVGNVLKSTFGGGFKDMTDEEKKAFAVENIVGATQGGSHFNPLGRVIHRMAGLGSAESAIGDAAAKGADFVAKFGEQAPTEPLTDYRRDPEATAAVLRAEKWDPPFTSPVNKAIKKAKEKGILRTAEDLWAITESPDPVKAANDLYLAKHAEQSAADKQQFGSAITDQQVKDHEQFLKDLEALNKERELLSTQKEELLKMPDTEKLAGEKMLLLSQISKKFANVEDRQAQVMRAYREKWPVDRQPAGLLTEVSSQGDPHGPAIPVEPEAVVDAGGELPAMPSGELAGGPAALRAHLMPPPPPNAAEQLRAPTQRMLPAPNQPDALTAVQQRIEALRQQREAGINQQREAEVEAARKRLEDEQRRPFSSGDAEVRHSGAPEDIMWPAAQQAARALRRYYKPDELRGGFVLSAPSLLRERKPLGVVPDAAGNLPTAGLVAKMKQLVPAGELDAYKAAGLENYLATRKSVNAEDLAAWMNENGPRVEIKELRPIVEKVDPVLSRMLALRHELETAGLWKYGSPRGSDEYVLTDGLGVPIDHPTVGQLGWDSDKGMYAAGPEVPLSSLDPRIQEYIKLKRENDLGGYARQRQYEGSTGDEDATIGNGWGVEPRKVDKLIDPVEILVKDPGEVKFDEGHHGKSGRNAFVFSRAYTEKLPTGEKVFHVFEHQSDWNAARQAKIEGYNKIKKEFLEFDKAELKFTERSDGLWGVRMRTPEGVEITSMGKSKEDAKDQLRTSILFFMNQEAEAIEKLYSNPLLSDHKRLGFKAAIQHAIETGHDYIALSDADTAMMTEGHDRAAKMVEAPFTGNDLVAGMLPDDLARFAEYYEYKYGADWKNGIYTAINQENEGRLDSWTVLRLDKPENNVNNRSKQLARELLDAGYARPREGDGYYIPQERGMRFNYDRGYTLLDKNGAPLQRFATADEANRFKDSLPRNHELAPFSVQGNEGPSILAELTGDAGTPVNFGPHGKGESSVLRNPDGTLKSDITATMFSLRKPREMADEHVMFSLYGRDKAYYSTIFPVDPEGLSKVGEQFGRWLKRKGIGITDAPNVPKILHAFTTSIRNKYTQDGSPAALNFAAAMPDMYTVRNKVQNEAVTRTRQFNDLLDSEEGAKWIQRSYDGQSWASTASLPAELRPLADAWKKHIEWYADEAKARGQKRAARGPGGKIVYDFIKKIPGYFPYPVDKAVWRDLAAGGDTAKQRIDEWLKWVSKRDPKRSADDALMVLDDMKKSAGIKARTQSEPTFAPMREESGLGIPPEWRAQDLRAAMNSYDRAYGTDAAWTETVQKSPLMRLALGVDRDQAGNPTRKADIKYRPTQAEWTRMARQAVEGGIDISHWKPDMDLGGLSLADSADIGAFIANFRQRPLAVPTFGTRLVNSLNGIAGSLMMQSTTGARDFMQSVSAALEATGFNADSAKALADAVSSPRVASEKALRAGAMQEDIYSQQGENVMFEAAYKTARMIRKMTGRQIADEKGKAFAFNIARETALAQLKRGETKLVDQFYTGDRKGLTNEELADRVGVAVAEYAAPSYNALNLPSSLLPETGNWLGHLMRLSTWNVARFNGWYNKAYRPMIENKDPSMFLRTLLTGIVGGAAFNYLKEYLTGKKPRELTWQEWMNLGSEDQAREAAPLMFGLMDAQGTMGIMSTFLKPVVGLAAGKPADITPRVPEMPVFLVGQDVARTMIDFENYVKERGGWGRLDYRDIVDLGHELAKTVQLYRDLERFNPLGEDEVELSNIRREQRLYENMTHRSAVTDHGLQPFAFEEYVPGKKFSLSKSFNRRSADEMASLLPSLEEAAARGQNVRVTGGNYSDEFYRDIANRQGMDAARRIYNQVHADDDHRDALKDLARQLRSLNPR